MDPPKIAPSQSWLDRTRRFAASEPARRERTSQDPGLRSERTLPAETCQASTILSVHLIRLTFAPQAEEGQGQAHILSEKDVRCERVSEFVGTFLLSQGMLLI